MEVSTIILFPLLVNNDNKNNQLSTFFFYLHSTNGKRQKKKKNLQIRKLPSYDYARSADFLYKHQAKLELKYAVR